MKHSLNPTQLREEIEHKLENLKETITKKGKSFLENKGIRPNPVDISAVLEELSPKASRLVLSYVLELIQPFMYGMGLRISHLSDEKVEAVLPARAHNLNESGYLHEGAFVAAASEMLKILWQRHAPIGDLAITAENINLRILKNMSEDVRLRSEIIEQDRELVLHHLRSRSEAQHEGRVVIFDQHEQIVAECELKLKLVWIQTLSGGSSGSN